LAIDDNADAEGGRSEGEEPQEDDEAVAGMDDAHHPEVEEIPFDEQDFDEDRTQTMLNRASNQAQPQQALGKPRRTQQLLV
jgi:hypothetical protein